MGQMACSSYNTVTGTRSTFFFHLEREVPIVRPLWQLFGPNDVIMWKHAIRDANWTKHVDRAICGSDEPQSNLVSGAFTFQKPMVLRSNAGDDRIRWLFYIWRCSNCTSRLQKEYSRDQPLYILVWLITLLTISVARHETLGHSSSHWKGA